MFYVNSILFQFFLSLFLFISFIFSDEIIIDKPQIKEKIIKETYYGYHHLRAASARQTAKVVYAPDTTPHGYPSWPYDYVYGWDTLLYEADYHFSNNHRGYDYKKSDFYPVHIKVKKDTLIQFTDQVSEYKTEYKPDGRKRLEQLKVTNYDHYNRRDRDTGIGTIINQISSTTSTKIKTYRYNNSASYDVYIHDKGDLEYAIYYPFFSIKDSTLHSIVYRYDVDKMSYLNKEVSYRYGLINIEEKKKSFITQIKHTNNHRDFHVRNKAISKNHRLESKFNIPRAIPMENCYEGICTPDSLSFFTDSRGRTVKRKTFYVYDDCSYGGYATTDSIFNNQGQLVIEKPGYHGNGTTMGPPYTNKEFKYHDNGQIAEIISDGNTARSVYNENGQILIKEYLGPENMKDIYEYDEHGNLILFIFDFDLGSESYKVKYEHIYNDKDLLIESYIYYQPDPSWKQGDSDFSTRLVDDNNLDKYLISRYQYDKYDQLIRKEEYMKDRGRIPSFRLGNLCPEFNEDSCIKYGLLYKLTTYEYDYYNCFDCKK